LRLNLKVPGGAWPIGAIKRLRPTSARKFASPRALHGFEATMTPIHRFQIVFQWPALKTD
jgi:hypothetical protein